MNTSSTVFQGRNWLVSRPVNFLLLTICTPTDSTTNSVSIFTDVTMLLHWNAKTIADTRINVRFSVVAQRNRIKQSSRRFLCILGRLSFCNVNSMTPLMFVFVLKFLLSIRVILLPSTPLKGHTGVAVFSRNVDDINDSQLCSRNTPLPILLHDQDYNSQNTDQNFWFYKSHARSPSILYNYRI